MSSSNLISYHTVKTARIKNGLIWHIKPDLIQVHLPSDKGAVLSLLLERFSVCSCFPTGPPERDRRAGSMAAGCSEGGWPAGCAGSVCYPVEPLSAPPSAQPEETHQDTSAQAGPSFGGHSKVFFFLKFIVMNAFFFCCCMCFFSEYVFGCELWPRLETL